ncbi:MAG TPA: capsule assembly Wzi family protein [Candidatus Deferrimicrobium sp.]|nr:capsule assembly Wzi family protein [Candidatus Deferrimicrobium sp.]
MFALVSFADSSGTGVLPVGMAEYEFVYERIERDALFRSDYFISHLGPYRFDHVTFDRRSFGALQRLPSGRVAIFGVIGEDFRAARHAAGRSWESLRGGMAASPHERLFVYANFVLDEQLARNPSYTGKKWRGLAGDLEQAFVHYRAGPMALTVGRFASFWGPRSSLILSAHTALDGFAYTFRWGRLALSYRLARLDGVDPATDSVAPFENRYFAGHRVDLMLSRRLQIGLFETVIFGGPGRQVELYYLNPIMFYHGAQLNEGNDDNSLVGLDFSVKPMTGIEFYGQLVVDDFQIDRKTPADQEPDEIAFLSGVYAADVLSSVDIKAQYARVANRTFNQALPRNRYLYRDQPLGSAVGNDYDEATATLRRWIGPNAVVSLYFVYRRQGEGGVTDEWTTPWLLATGEYNESFPTGVVRKTGTAGLNIRGWLFGHFYLDAGAGVERVTNLDHAAGVRRTSPFVEIKVSAFAFSHVGVE